MWWLCVSSLRSMFITINTSFASESSGRLWFIGVRANVYQQWKSLLWWLIKVWIREFSLLVILKMAAMSKCSSNLNVIISIDRSLFSFHASHLGWQFHRVKKSVLSWYKTATSLLEIIRILYFVSLCKPQNQYDSISYWQGEWSNEYPWPCFLAQWKWSVDFLSKQIEIEMCKLQDSWYPLELIRAEPDRKICGLKHSCGH